MSRCIDADALKIDFYDEYETEDDAYAYGYVSKYQIDMAPTIDAVSVVHGHYIKGRNGEWYCSECKRIDDKYSVAKFCWYCGAKMDGERKESE